MKQTNVVHSYCLNALCKALAIFLFSLLPTFALAEDTSEEIVVWGSTEEGGSTDTIQIPVEMYEFFNNMFGLLPGLPVLSWPGGNKGGDSLTPCEQLARQIASLQEAIDRYYKFMEEFYALEPGQFIYVNDAEGLTEYPVGSLGYFRFMSQHQASIAMSNIKLLNLEAQYNSECSDNGNTYNYSAPTLGGQPAIVDNNLNLEIPNATIQTSNGPLDIWVRLRSSGKNSSGKFSWELENFGVN